MHDGYFEGILQLRNPNKEVIEYIAKRMEEENIFVAKQHEEKDGIDLYISSRKFLQNLAQKLQKQFGGEMRISPTLFSRNNQTSKDIYRITVYYKLPAMKKGDIIDFQGDKVKVLIVGKKVYVQDEKTGKKRWVEHSKFKM